MTKYFISYYAQTRWGNTRWGCLVVETNIKIINGETFADMVEYIKKETKFKKVVIINFKELGETE